jgi:MFS family permease
MTATRGRFAGLSRNTFLLAAASLFGDISTEMLYPVLPVFLTQVLGASGSIVGLVDGVAQAAQSLVQGVAGSISDRLRRHKPVVLVGSFLAAIAKPVMGVAAAWPDLLGSRLIDRFGAGIRSAPRDALLAASVDAKDRGRAFGLEGAGDNAGAFLGPLLAVVLLGALGLDLRTIFYLAVIPGLLAVAMVLLVRERPVAVAARARIDLGVRQFPRGYWACLVALGLFGVGNSSNAFLILRTEDAGATLATTILIYAGYNLIAALVSYPAGSLSDRWGRRTLLLVALGVFAVTYLGFALTTEVLALGALFAFYGVYQGIFRAVGKALAVDFVPEHLRASGIGWYGATVGLLQLVASVVAGALWDTVGHAAVFYYGTASALVGGVALVVLVPRHGARPASSHALVGRRS